MNAKQLIGLMDFSVEYQASNTTLRRKVVAGQNDAYGKTWVLVETQDDANEVTRQWVEMTFFKAWLESVGCAA